MKNFRKMPFAAVVRSLLSCEDSSRSIISQPLERVELSYAGLADDSHNGITRAACSRFPYLYEEGVEIRNSRQLSLVSSEELAEIAAGMGIEELQPGWLGANIELSGIPQLTLLPPSTRLVFASKATLVVDLENRPCVYPARVIDSHYPNKGRKFVRQAMHKRGLCGWVEREGSIACGDSVEVYFPEQYPHPMQLSAD